MILHILDPIHSARKIRRSRVLRLNIKKLVTGWVTDVGRKINSTSDPNRASCLYYRTLILLSTIEFFICELDIVGLVWYVCL